MKPFPELDADTLCRRIAAVLDAEARSIDDDAWRRLQQHYALLCRWAPRMALIGRGTVEDAPEVHYGESLAALPALPPGPCIDFGSGAGFPGLLLAACRPQQDFVLIESRQRKAAFLRQAAAQMGLSRCRVLAVRWGSAGPDADLASEQLEGLRPFSALTARAVDMAPWTLSLDSLLAEDAVWLAWGAGAAPSSGSEWRPSVAEPLPGARGLLVYRRQAQTGDIRTRL